MTIQANARRVKDEEKFEKDDDEHRKLTNQRQWKAIWSNNYISLNQLRFSFGSNSKPRRHRGQWAV